MWPENNEVLVLRCPVFVVGSCTMKKALQVYQQYISNSEIYGSATGKKMGTDRWREVSVQLHKKKAGLEASGRRVQSESSNIIKMRRRPTNVMQQSRYSLFHVRQRNGFQTKVFLNVQGANNNALMFIVVFP